MCGTTVLAGRALHYRHAASMRAEHLRCCMNTIMCDRIKRGSMHALMKPRTHPLKRPCAEGLVKRSGDDPLQACSKYTMSAEGPWMVCVKLLMSDCAKEW